MPYCQKYKKAFHNLGFILIFLLVGSGLSMSFNSASASNAWTYEQKFNTLNDGDLQGQDSWTGDATGWAVVTTGTPYEGTKHVMSPSASKSLYRAIGTLASGTFYFSTKYSLADYGPYFQVFNDSGLADITLAYNPNVPGTGLFYYEGGTPSWVKLTDYSNGVYQRIGIAFECGAGGWEGLSAGYFKLSVDNGAWSSAIKMERASRSTLNTLKIMDGGYTGTMYVDYISPIYTDVAPSLTLVKTVINDNGGDKQVAEFPLFVNGSPATSGVANVLSANTLYTATETTLAGYTSSAWGGDCAPDGTITLLPGDDKTCTITNDDNPSLPYCGDTSCNGDENCSTCSQDCGICSGGGGSGGLFFPSLALPASPPLSLEAQRADTNKDNKIDLLDFNTLIINWGTNAPGNVADFNGDGTVDILDFNFLMIYWTG